MTSSKNAALAALLSSAVTGQQLMFVPLSPHSAVLPRAHAGTPLGAAGEPPCRRLRLASFRHAIREGCRAVPGCGGPADPRALAGSSLISQTTTLEKEMDALFADLFVPRFSLLLGSAGGEEEEEEDSFDVLFNAMLGTSIRAYDRKVLDLPIATLGVEEGEEVVDGEEEAEEAVEKEEEEEENEGENEIEDSYVSQSADYLEAAATPEEAAENALDVMVASLARSGALATKGGDGEEEVTGSADAVSADVTSTDAVSTEWLPQVLSRLGQYVENHSRRRLSEELGAPDPHARVRERLARRLTEYSSNVFVSSDGTVTMYTTSHAPLASFHSSFPSSPFEAAPSSSFLGTGSRRADECLRSRFDNGDLEGGCDRAVGEFLLATDALPRAAPGRLAPNSMRGNGEPVRGTPFDRFLNEGDAEVDARPCMFAAVHRLALFFLLMGCAMRVCACFRQEEEEDEEEEQGLPKKRLSPYELGYAALHEEDAKELASYIHVSEPCQGFSGAARSTEHVFVGVPIQVV